jgi:hypothetical protein
MLAVWTTDYLWLQDARGEGIWKINEEITLIINQKL